MKIVIIEDEKLTAEDLAGTITELDPDAEIVSFLYSVKEAICYFKNNALPDLIFSDIQLGDGLSFEIFKSVSISSPVIFCTAYDEFALNAFKANGIDYLLKPFSSKSISEALHKYKTFFKSVPGKTIQVDEFLELLKSRKTPKSTSVLVHYKDKILPIRLEDIALFYIEDEVTHLMTFEKKTYYINKNLDELMQITGNGFYRINRQYLVNRKTVSDATQYFSRKLSVNLVIPFKDTLTVSKEKIPSFLKWLEYEH
ncbi:MAG: LytTR family DNA-binding domain-containing protein [Bacteroidales bacterium]|nr:LytTR family DNA-binding domain-containing protein [Bacteroidales bacterium]